MGNEADPAGVRVAIVAAGNGHVLESDAATLLTNDGCLEGLPGLAETPPDATATDVGGMRLLPTSDEPVAVAYTPKGELVVQIREPAALEIHDPATGDITARIPLGGGSRLDTAHQLFHSNPDARSSTNIACASCHPEGRDDGHVWQFVGQGARRTMSLASFSTTTAPFHWSGDLSDVSALMDDVFVGRMGGQPQSTARKEAISAWLDRMPSAPRSSFVDTTAAARGKQLFEDPTVGCATCHSGPKLTNNVTVAVGTGSALQVPSLLGLGARAPYMHDGCAPTLRDRFLSESCGGGEAHGHTAQLSSAQIDDLVAYLSSL
jgi:mono/diheme cytochrome c family protein